MKDKVLIKSIRQSNYLQENGIYPVREFPDGDLYKTTKEFLSLLDRYSIEKFISNKPR